VFVGAGVNHFVHAGFYERMIPPGFPAPGVLVWVSGGFEILGGAGLLAGLLRGVWFSRVGRVAGWGLIALLLAVFPANVYMAIAPERFAELGMPGWALWARLPLQAVMMGWVWLVGIRRGRGKGPGRGQAS